MNKRISQGKRVYEVCRDCVCCTPDTGLPVIGNLSYLYYELEFHKHTG
jgi:hypothetical protein